LTGGKPSGVGGYTLALLRAMTASHPEHRFVILTTGSPYRCRPVAKEALGDLSGKRNVVYVHRSVVNRILNLFILLTGRPTFEQLFGEAVDVIWCPNLNFLPKSRAPRIVTFHDLSFAMMPRLYSPWRRLWHTLVRPRSIARRAAALITPSNTTAMDLTRLYDLKTPKHREETGVTTPVPSLKRRGIEVIPHGVDEAFSPRPEPQDHGVRSRHDLPRHYLLHIGTDEPRKNLVRLVRAFEEAKRQSETMRRLDTKLVLAGASKLESLLSTVYRLPSHSIIPLDYVKDADRPALYRGASALVFPSLYEGFGMPILEAFASGTPVITSQNSAMLEVGGPAALFVDPENERDLARAIQTIVEDEKLRNHLVQVGLKRAENYRWDKSAEATIRVFEECIFTSQPNDHQKRT